MLKGLFFFAIAVGLVGCHQNSGSTPDPVITARQTPDHQIYIETTVPAEQAQVMSGLVDSVSHLSFDDLDADVKGELQALMGIKDLQADLLKAWLEDRVQYILSADFKVQDSAFFSDEAFTYPNASALPDVWVGNHADSGASVLMANLGASIYAAGKEKGKLIGINFQGLPSPIFLRSPREGIVQIGPGLFPKGIKVSEQALRIYRLGILFHEARHSDGNGKSLGFMHDICPKDSPYAGKSACDAPTNGAYTIGSHLHRALALSCKDCTTVDQEWLKLQFLDLSSRLLPEDQAEVHHSPETPIGKDWDPTPEGQR